MSVGIMKDVGGWYVESKVELVAKSTGFTRARCYAGSTMKTVDEAKAELKEMLEMIKHEVDADIKALS